MAGGTLRLTLALGAVALGAALAPGCSSNPARGLCRDVCGCEGCSDSEEEACFEAADDAQEQAESEGCTEELGAYVDCRKDAFKCDDERAVFTESCSRESDDLIECGGVPPGDLCRVAAQVCGVQGEGEGEGECTGAAQCAAQCIVSANSCDFNDPALTECFTNCT